MKGGLSSSSISGSHASMRPEGKLTVPMSIVSTAEFPTMSPVKYESGSAQLVSLSLISSYFLIHSSVGIFIPPVCVDSYSIKHRDPTS